MKANELAELKRLASGGLLDPKKVVASAKPQASPLHHHFEWDDGKAARAYRLDQARALIQMAVEVEPSLGIPVRVFVSLSSDRKQEGGYRETTEVLNKTALRRIMLQDAFRELDQFKARFLALSELSPIFQTMEAIKAKVAPSKKVKAA